jgi:hypothetical protein
MNFVHSVQHGGADVTTLVPAASARTLVASAVPFSALVRAGMRHRTAIDSPWPSEGIEVIATATASQAPSCLDEVLPLMRPGRCSKIISLLSELAIRRHVGGRRVA